MNPADRFEEFERLWKESVDRAGRRPTWNDLCLVEQKVISSQFRREMIRYGEEDLTENRMDGGLYNSPKISRQPGERPGLAPDERT